MSQTLWISLPQPQVNALKELFDYIKVKKLSSINSNQLAEKLSPLRIDRNWSGLFAKYNKIPSINNIPINRLFSCSIGLIAKLKKYDSNLPFKTFQPCELISLFILYSINENFIDSNLCKALSKNDLIAIKKEILEKGNISAAIISEINTYLLIYALYTNNYSVRLPQNIIDNTRLYVKQNDIALTEIDNQIRNVRSLNPIKEFSFAYPSVLENYSYAHKLIEADRLVPITSNTSPNNINNILLTGISLFFFLKHIPVIYQIGKNIHKDLTKANHFIRNSLFKTNSKSKSVSNFDGTSQQCRLI